jgi:ankyrin repeat protein
MNSEVMKACILHRGMTERNACLRQASVCGRLSIVRLLVDNGANIHDDDDAPLRLAVSYNHTAVAEYLINLGADVNVHDSYPLRAAIGHSNHHIVRLLLDKGASTDGIVNYSLDATIIQLLLDHGVKMAINDYCMVQARSLPTLRMLVANGGNIHVFNNTILIWAAFTGDADTVHFLVDECGGFHGDSITDAIKHAKMGGHNELVTYLSSLDV